jgi:tetratricopeptide (TPR) repeat protein
MRKLLALVLFLISLPSPAKDLVVNSFPDKAEIRLSSPSGGTIAQKAGETPFKISLAEVLRSYANGNNVFVLEVVKEGYETYRIIIPEFLKSDLTIDVVLTQKNDLEFLKRVDKGMNLLFEAQRMIRSRNYQGAQSKIAEVEQLIPKLSITKELEASAYYLQNDFKRALDYYQQAFAANGENLDAYKMIVYLEKAMGLTKASDTTGAKQ